MILVGVIAYFVGNDGTVQSILMSMKWIENAHSDENIAAVVESILEELRIIEKLGYFICDI